ncbi:YALI0D04026p [Yarrowia lipolytica CLIB122]|jgi:acyl-CoA-dependent ceramide synthase|uniref:YALI0D04026p n=2 Tax=Yarrowia lipolytica TaxID=4952 RepID=F2Z5Z1_YARLI|nr:YALI0D04026p [Yarrowia lipolytica CLIB122]AAO25120.1 longevity-assurance protein [Yarrowia lipolytica]AOW03552.1 hypothetical protein YALI1_D05038g [Yarrowia lipolytica]KAJ8054820.1 longevity-assurance protein [Yarrowia lipolytica]QNP97638.1 Sphingosine N-acyltransferase lag1 [Yarrowia lipolytica]CAG80574.1 YALI0D04026p [Yarrowia lipolytica CLIB122]|eukprot:XP_502386.1 YALI0D04026p [Yarrowia lipolytica CLIB122]
MASPKGANPVEASKPPVAVAHKQKTTAWRGLMDYLSARQITLPLKVLTYIVVMHRFAALRPYTRKFFHLQYPKHEVDGVAAYYSRGRDDIYFVLTGILALTFLRAACMDFVLVPMARALKITKRKPQLRFAEQGWALIYYTSSTWIGFYLYYHSPYWLNVEELWRGYPHFELDPFFKAYYLIQFSFWVQQIFVLNMEEKRKDHYQMFTHHIVTCALMCGSYYYYYTRVGHLILVLMDGVDTLLASAKMLKYLRYDTMCDAMFGLFVIAWVVLRHGLYNYVTWSAYFQAPVLVAENCLRDEDGQETCFNPALHRVFVVLLIALQIITLIWLYMIVRVIVKILKGGGAEDSRSDDEDSDEEEGEAEGEEEEEEEEEVMEEKVSDDN